MSTRKRIVIGSLAAVVGFGIIGAVITPDEPVTGTARAEAVVASTPTTPSTTTAAPTTTVAPPAPTATRAATPPKRTTQTTSPAEYSPAQLDRAFLSVLDDEDIFYSSKSAAYDMGHTICEGFDANLSPALIVLAMKNADTDASYTDRQIGILIGASIGAYCPAHADKIN